VHGLVSASESQRQPGATRCCSAAVIAAVRPVRVLVLAAIIAPLMPCLLVLCLWCCVPTPCSPKASFCEGGAYALRPSLAPVKQSCPDGMTTLGQRGASNRACGEPARQLLCQRESTHAWCEQWWQRRNPLA
jgi:hypothetical protein